MIDSEKMKQIDSLNHTKHNTDNLKAKYSERKYIMEIGTHRTTCATIQDPNSNKVLIVTYHSTPVVKVINDRYVVLNNGGYYTNTTKRRMNQASLQYSLGYEVYQVDFIWYVSIGKEIAPFHNGIVIDTKKDIICLEMESHPVIDSDTMYT